MARTPSTMSMSLGDSAPDFTLPDTVSGKNISLADIRSEIATVIMFICNHCPFVIHVQPELVRLANEYIPKNIQFVAISSNDIVNYPQDSPEKMRKEAQKAGYRFPYLYDESQEVAKRYDAACTPDFYIFDKDLKCVYRGQLDDSRPGNDQALTGRDIRNALEAILNNQQVTSEQKPSIGCNIKWK
ncbi:MAG: thioredoxin family protein [Spirochaetota bacterium]